MLIIAQDILYVLSVRISKFKIFITLTKSLSLIIIYKKNVIHEIDDD